MPRVRVENFPQNFNKQQIQELLKEYQIEQIDQNEEFAHLLLKNDEQLESLKLLPQNLKVSECRNDESGKMDEKLDEKNAENKARSENKEEEDMKLEPIRERRVFISSNIETVNQLEKESLRKNLFEKFEIEKIVKYSLRQQKLLFVIDFLKSTEIDQFQLEFDKLKYKLQPKNSQFKILEKDFDVEECLDSNSNENESQLPKQESSKSFENIKDENKTRSILRDVFLSILLLLALYLFTI